MYENEVTYFCLLLHISENSSLCHVLELMSYCYCLLTKNDYLTNIKNI